MHQTAIQPFKISKDVYETFSYFCRILCIVTSSLYSGHENSIASTSSSYEQSSLTPAVLPFLVTTHITAVSESLSNIIHGDDKNIIENALDTLGFHAMKILLDEIAKENERTPKEEEILETTSSYLAQFNEQECHLDQLKMSAELINTTLESPIRGISNHEIASLREAINSLTLSSQNLIQSQQESTTEQRDQLKNQMLLVIQKTMECCK